MRYLQKIDEQINKQMKLIEDLLNASKVQRGKLEYELTKFDINEVVREIVESFQAISSHKINVRGKARKKVVGDKDRIGQVVTNLISNAIKYSPKADKVNVVISQLKNKVKVSVQDFGIGISEDQQMKIFDQFYQVNNPHEKTYPGLGIGLYISYDIIKRHGGNIKVKSEQGTGTVFSFTLPLKS